MTNESAPTASAFHTTRWTRVLAARGDSPDSEEALRDLCADYYGPVVAFLAREGRTVDEAREVAHGFFAELLGGGALRGLERGRGRFRSYLLGALKHHVSRLRQRDGRLRRGGGAVHLRLDAEDAAGVLALDEALTPDEAFDRQWALTVLARAMRALEGEAAARGAAEEFERLRPWLVGGAPHGGQRATAEALGRSPNAFKVAVHRIRREFRARVRAEVARTLEEPASVDEEMRALLASLG